MSVSEENLCKIRIEADPCDPDSMTETVWAERVGRNRYKLCNTPCFSHDLSYADVVFASKGNESGPAMPVFRRILEKSGYKTIIVALDREFDSVNPNYAIVEQLEQAGCDIGFGTARFFSVTIPPHIELETIARLLNQSTEDMTWEIYDPSEMNDVMGQGEM